jgi:hypothetical protein
MKKTAYIILVAMILTVVGQTFAYPKPAIVPGFRDWTLGVKFSQPTQVTVNIPSVGKARYWYIIVSLTNSTKQDVPFHPACDLMTDTFDVIASGHKTMNYVFARIKLINQGKYPFLEYIETSGNKILQGKDNSRDIAIIWPDFDANAKNINLFIGGLANESIAIDHPIAKDENGQPLKVYLRKTLQLKYAIGGDATLRQKASLAYRGKDWVLR